MKKLFFLGLIFLGLTAFGQEKKQVDEQAIRAVSNKWLELENKNDFAAIAALFADDGVAYRLNQEPAVGPAAIKKLFTQLHEQNSKSVADWTTDRVEIATSGDMAVEYGKYNEKGLGPDGTGTDQGRYATVYRKVNGVWKITADISVSTKPKVATK
jgi:uncharacterized protein (TIGR02246 family)